MPEPWTRERVEALRDSIQVYDPIPAEALDELGIGIGPKGGRHFRVSEEYTVFVGRPWSVDTLRAMLDKRIALGIERGEWS